MVALVPGLGELVCRVPLRSVRHGDLQLGNLLSDPALGTVISHYLFSLTTHGIPCRLVSVQAVGQDRLQHREMISVSVSDGQKYHGGGAAILSAEILCACNSILRM